MSTLGTIAILVVAGTLNLVCFFIGANVGSRAAKGEKITAPTINPMEVIRARQDKKEAQREQDRYDTIMQNVENYNGTSMGQKDVPLL
jgi:hypothetical protein